MNDAFLQFGLNDWDISFEFLRNRAAAMKTARTYEEVPVHVHENQGAEVDAEPFETGRQREALEPEHGIQNPDGVVPGPCPEKDPGDVHEIEGKEPAEQPRHLKVQPGPEPVNDRGRAVQEAPEHEGPSCAMPEAADQERGHQVQIRPACSPSGSRPGGCRCSPGGTG